MIKLSKTKIHRNESMIGERIETKIERLLVSKEPIHDTAEMVYTDRKDGVMPAYDIRTDKMELALEAMDKFQKSKQAERKEYYKKQDEPKAEPVIIEQKPTPVGI